MAIAESRREEILWELKRSQDRRALKVVLEKLREYINREVQVSDPREKCTVVGMLSRISLSVNAQGEPRLRYGLAGGGDFSEGLIYLRSSVYGRTDAKWDLIHEGVGPKYLELDSSEVFLAEDPRGDEVRCSLLRVAEDTTLKELRDFADWDDAIVSVALRSPTRGRSDRQGRKVIAELSFDHFIHSTHQLTPESVLLWREYEDGMRALYFAQNEEELELYLADLALEGVSRGAD